MSTTLKDFGRHSEKFGDIKYYYIFAHRFYVNDHQLAPNDMLTWCREHCDGYYKITCYTHNSSKRDPVTGEYLEKVIYVDKVYLEDEGDALKIGLTFDTTDLVIKRPKMERFKKPE